MPDADRTELRCAVLCGGGALEGWQAQCLERLAAVRGVRAVASIVGEGGPADLPGPWAGLPAVPLSAAGRLREFELDVILWFADLLPPAELLDLPRHGVWRYLLGDWRRYRGPAGGFWEVYDGCESSAAMLVRLLPDPDAVIVLREGHLRTRRLSVGANRDQLLTRFTRWPAEVCEELQRVPGSAVGRSPLRSTTAPRGLPSAGQRARLALRIALRTAATGWRALFRHDQWNIGIVDRPIEDFASLRAPPPVRWLPPPRRGELRADPFGFVADGRPTILCEHYSYGDNRGVIVAIEPEGECVQRPVRIGPERPVHLSYPFLVEHAGRLYCVPESSAAQAVTLFEVERFPDRWTAAATLIEGRGLADATLFAFQGRWWLAASEVADKGANAELHLWFADELRGPWRAHPGNPVKTDVRSARPAGTPFWADGALHRPAQDCSSTYGARVVINRIHTLTPDEFREEAVTTVDPDPHGAYPNGLHTLAPLGSVTLVDGKRSQFAWAEFRRVVRHYLT